MTGVLVLGGYGAVGRPAVDRLRRAGHTVVAVGRDPHRADRVVDLRQPDLDDYRRALTDIDVVLNVSGAEDVRLAVLAGRAGAAFVDASADTGYVDALTAVETSTPIVTGVGLAPGLTNLLAWSVRDGGPVDVAVYLGLFDDHGRAAAQWTWGLLGRDFPDTGRPGHRVRNYTAGGTFDLPGIGRRRLLRADFADQHELTRDTGVPVRTFFGLDSRTATAGLALLTRLPGASRLPVPPALGGRADWLVLARTADDTTAWAAGRSQSRATGVLSAVAVERAAGLPPGPHPLHRVLRLDEVPTDGDLRVHPRARPS